MLDSSGAKPISWQVRVKQLSHGPSQQGLQLEATASDTLATTRLFLLAPFIHIKALPVPSLCLVDVHTEQSETLGLSFTLKSWIIIQL